MPGGAASTQSIGRGRWSTGTLGSMDFASANAAVAAADELDVPTMELLARVEATGEAFYDLLADRIGNDDAAELLRRNGREEMGHARRLRPRHRPEGG